MIQEKPSSTLMFQYMLLLRGATGYHGTDRRNHNVSIHAPLARSNWSLSSCSPRDAGFQYMLLLRGATFFRLTSCTIRPIVSIHAPLARSNKSFFLPFFGNVFQYMLLLRGATRRRAPVRNRRSFNTCSSCEEQLEKQLNSLSMNTFQYMLLLRGATRSKSLDAPPHGFQYMLLLRGATDFSGMDDILPFVSIHAPLARSNKDYDYETDPQICFNTCSSCEEQLQFIFRLFGFSVSIHAPLARSNYIPPCNRRRAPVSIHAPLARSNCFMPSFAVFQYVSIHAPLARSNFFPVIPAAGVPVSIHAPLARSNSMDANLKSFDWLFQYMLLLRGATFPIQPGLTPRWFQYMLLLRGATGGTVTAGIQL